MVRHKETGYLVKRPDPDDLAAALLYVLENPAYVVRTTENAYTFAHEHFSKENVLEKIKVDFESTVPRYCDSLKR